MVKRSVGKLGPSLVIAGVMGCNVSSPPHNTGGVVLDGGGQTMGGSSPDAAPDTGSVAESGEAGTDGAPSIDAGEGGGAPVCPGALSVVCTDYTTTNIEIAGLDGTMLSGSFVSSGSTATGLTTALSGDVVVPYVAPPSSNVVLIDQGNNVITWMNLSSAAVVGQLDVSTGFDSDPYDYIETDASHAYVCRYQTNASPGNQMYDQGGDLLILDTSNRSITGRIAMPEENAALTPSPAAMNWIGSDVVVTLQRFSSDFTQVGDGRFVGVSPTSNAIAWTVNITGLQNCGRVYVSPSGTTGAIACSGQPSMSSGGGTAYAASGSDIVLYDLTRSPPAETKRFGLGTSLDAGLQPTLTFANETTILGLTFGGDVTPGDTAFALDVTSGTTTQLLSETMEATLTGPYCLPGCNDICLVTDSEANAIRRWQFAPGADGGTTFTATSNESVDPTVGLPPVQLGYLR